MELSTSTLAHPNRTSSTRSHIFKLSPSLSKSPIYREPPEGCLILHVHYFPSRCALTHPPSHRKNVVIRSYITVQTWIDM